MYTLNNPPLFQLALGDSADAVSGKVGVPGLDTAQTTQILVTLLLPLGYQSCVSNFFLNSTYYELLKKNPCYLDAEFVKLPRDGLSSVEKVEDVSKREINNRRQL